MRAAEVTHQILFRIAAFLLADHHHTMVVDRGQSADDRVVVGKTPVAVQFDEAGRDALQVIQHVRTLRVAGQLHALPGREVGEDFFLGRFEFVFDGVNLRGEIDLLFGGLLLKRLQRLFQFGNGFFEFECIDFHNDLACDQS